MYPMRFSCIYLYLRGKCYPRLCALLQANRLVAFEPILADHAHIKAALASDLPVVMGITIYESFESREVAKTGRDTLTFTT